MPPPATREPPLCCRRCAPPGVHAPLDVCEACLAVLPNMEESSAALKSLKRRLAECGYCPHWFSTETRAGGGKAGPREGAPEAGDFWRPRPTTRRGSFRVPSKDVAPLW